jgi:hypothetical protein
MDSEHKQDRTKKATLHVIAKDDFLAKEGKELVDVGNAAAVRFAWRPRETNCP